MRRCASPTDLRAPGRPRFAGARPCALQHLGGPPLPSRQLRLPLDGRQARLPSRRILRLHPRSLRLSSLLLLPVRCFFPLKPACPSRVVTPRSFGTRSITSLPRQSPRYVTTVTTVTIVTLHIPRQSPRYGQQVERSARSLQGGDTERLLHSNDSPLWLCRRL